MQINDPFLLHLYGTCQTKNELYFVMEVLDRGDLYNVIYNGDRLSHEMCVFYGACIIHGLNFIHNKNIVYRDLKPENIMIGSNGYPRIVDFGLAKQLPYMKMSENNIMRKYTKCYTLCGTPEYVAPEIIMGKGYDTLVDIWAFGVLLYEMIFKITPFIHVSDDNNDINDVNDVNDVNNINDEINDEVNYNNDITKIFTNIIISCKNGIILSKKIDKKTDVTKNARNLITQLLNGDKNKRIGYKNIPLNLLNHPYFLSTSINFDDLYNQKVLPLLLQPEFIGRDISTAKNIEEYNGNQDIFKNFDTN